MDKPSNATAIRGGGGAGGSIRIEGNTITLGSLVATGGSPTDLNGYGGQGRIAVYYQSNVSVASSNPVRYSGILGQGPTATPSATPVSFAPPNPYGTGTDGNLTVDTSLTFNISTSSSNSRTCADAASYSVVELLASSAKLFTTPVAGCFAAGDEIMLIHLLGSGPNIGNFEYLRIGAVIGNTVYFKTPKANFYGANSTDDSNIGISANQQRVMLMRVPNYEDVTLNGTLTSNGFDGYRNGVMAFRVHGTLTGNTFGTISLNSGGFPGAVQGVSWAWGYSAGGQRTVE